MREEERLGFIIGEKSREIGTSGLNRIAILKSRFGVINSLLKHSNRLEFVNQFLNISVDWRSSVDY